MLLPLLCVGFVGGPCFVVQYLVSFLVLQSSQWERETEREREMRERESCMVALI